MNLPHQGHRIVWLVRLLTAIGLLMVVITTGLVGWTLARVRSERARATAEQERLDSASQALRERAVGGRGEIQTLLDETSAWTNQPSAAANLEEFIRRQLSSQPDPAVLASLNAIHAQASRLVE